MNKYDTKALHHTTTLSTYVVSDDSPRLPVFFGASTTTYQEQVNYANPLVKHNAQKPTAKDFRLTQADKQRKL